MEFVLFFVRDFLERIIRLNSVQNLLLCGDIRDYYTGVLFAVFTCKKY